jgi:hypothetical protein
MMEYWMKYAGNSIPFQMNNSLQEQKPNFAMIIRNSIITLLLLTIFNIVSGQEPQMKREVTLYNPYRPSLNETKKRSFLPEITDTAKFRPDFTYDVTATPFMPEYSISPIKAASLMPDPLNKLYKGYLKMGLGNPASPLAELSITNERSRKGAIGLYGRHYSNNGQVKHEDDYRNFAGYMDNELSLFGRKFFRNWILGGSLDYIQMSRYAYGRSTAMTDYFPGKKDVRLNYGNIGGTFSVASSSLDSSKLAFDFDVKYNYFHNSSDLYQHSFGIEGEMAKEYRNFYLGSGLEFDFYNIPDAIQAHPEYVFSLNPFAGRRTSQYYFRAGLVAMIERDTAVNAKPYIFPDLHFGFSMIKSYVNFFTSLTGKLEKNKPLGVVEVNPFIIPDGRLFRIPNTKHRMVVTAGLKGNTGIGGNYVLSASYSLVEDMLFFANQVSADTVLGRGNYFTPVTDDVDLFTLHAGMNGKLGEKMSFDLAGNYYKYTLTGLSHPLSKPDWDATFGLKYNLRDKILAGIQLTAIGDRKGAVYSDDTVIENPVTVDLPYHVNLNLSAEYRYSKILSFWTKFNNVSWNRYYEWAYYPSQRFLFMVGFTYSL